MEPTAEIASSYPSGYFDIRRVAMELYEPFNEEERYIPADKQAFAVSFARVHRDFSTYKQCDCVSFSN